MTSPKQPHDSDVQRLLGEHYEEVEMEATFRMALLDRTRQAVAARARPKYRLGLALAAGAALLLAVFALQVRNHGLTPAAGGTPAAGRARLVLITVRGDVKDGRGHALKVGDQLAAGATVRTGKASYLVMVTRQGSGLALDAKSELTVARDGKSAALRKGQVYCRNRKHEFAAVTTPAGKIHLLGTVIDAAMKGKDKVAVTVVEGRVKLANARGTAVVPAGRKAMLIASAAPGEGSAADVLAETAWVEGTLYFSYQRRMGPDGYTPVERIALTGSVQTEEGLPSDDADISPADETIVWSDTDGINPTETTLFHRLADGTEINLNERAGLTGLNCKPKWSPDGTMIAFQHCDAVAGTPACDVGFRVWVMSADGSGARPVAPPSAPTHSTARWTPDSQHLLVEVDAPGRPVCRVGLSGGEWQQLPTPIREAVASPNHRWLAGEVWLPGRRDGKLGLWRQLVLTDALGNSPRVLVQHFIAGADVAQYYPTAGQLDQDPQRDWIVDLQYHVGPCAPQWSPSGDQIAFTAALPFDPAGPYYREQTQVWIYDLNAEQLVQVTYDSGAHYSLVWSPNEVATGAAAR